MNNHNFTKKNTKLFLASFICLFSILFIAFYCPKPVNAASTVKYTINNSDYYIKSISISNKKLTVKGLPDGKNYSYIWLQIKDTNLDMVFDEIKEKSGSKMSFTLSSLKDGDYSISFYGGTQRYGNYKEFFKLNNLNIKDGKASFKKSPVRKYNAKYLKNEKTDETVLEYYLSADKYIDSDNKEIKKLAEKLTKGITDSYEKARVLHDWVAENIYYDYDVYYNMATIGDYSASGVLNSRRTVCEGYSNLLAALLRASGVPAKKVSGYALGLSTTRAWPEDYISGENKTSNHAWVEAYCDDRWVIIDATWDSGNEWSNGKVSKSDGLRYYKYFDPSLDYFSLDHLRLNDLNDINKNIKIWQSDNTNIKASAKAYVKDGVSGIKISWKADRDTKFDGYEVRRCDSLEVAQMSGYHNYLYSVKKTKNSYSDTNKIKPGKTYYYRVYGYINKNGYRHYSPVSNTVSITAK